MKLYYITESHEARKQRSCEVTYKLCALHKIRPLEPLLLHPPIRLQRIRHQAPNVLPYRIPMLMAAVLASST